MFLKFPCDSVRASLGGLVVKNPLANAGATGDADSTPPVRKIPWRREWQPTPVFFSFFHSNILAWEIPWTEEPGGLQSIESQRVGPILATEQQQQLRCRNRFIMRIMTLTYSVTVIYLWKMNVIKELMPT